MHVVIAPNAFKGSLDATRAAACIEKGLLESSLSCTCECLPVADGGDGTARLLTEYLSGESIKGSFHDPLERPVESEYGFMAGSKTAVIEMAATSGLALLQPDELDPMRTTSRGTGEMIRHALDRGAQKIILMLGGSATIDGGCGILSALGVRFYDDDGRQLAVNPKSLISVARIDASSLDPRMKSATIELWCDVRNRLLGHDGAAMVFGPQKGATRSQVHLLDQWLERLNALTRQQTAIDASTLPGGGAAGGTAAFLHAWLGARLVNGIERFLEITGFHRHLEGCDLVITGEGAVDAQTIQGKAPFGVAMAARRWNIPVVALAGSVPAEGSAALDGVFDAVLAIGHAPMDMQDAVRHTAENLTRASRELGNLLAVGRRRIDGIDR